LATEAGVPAPSLWRLASQDFNALVVAEGKPGIVVTDGVLESATRTELEAVAAHCLVRIARAGARAVPPLSFDDDLAATALTRYPPALAAAFRKATPRREGPGQRWFVPEGASSSPETRAREVLDL
jgi:hypothetical protein